MGMPDEKTGGHTKEHAFFLLRAGVARQRDPKLGPFGSLTPYYPEVSSSNFENPTSPGGQVPLEEVTMLHAHIQELERIEVNLRQQLEQKNEVWRKEKFRAAEAVERAACIAMQLRTMQDANEGLRRHVSNCDDGDPRLLCCCCSCTS